MKNCGVEIILKILEFEKLFEEMDLENYFQNQRWWNGRWHVA